MRSDARPRPVSPALIPCRCKYLNTLSGRAASDYVKQHLDVVRDEGHGRKVVTCPESATSFLVEPDDGVYGGDEQVRLRRTDR